MITQKNIIKLAAVALIAPMAIGCVSRRNYDNLEAEYLKVRDTNQELRSELETTEQQLTAVSKQQQKIEEVAIEKQQELLDREARLEQMEALVREQKQAVAALHQEVCSALKCFTPDELKIDVRNGKLYVSLSEQLLFPSGSASVNNRGEEAVTMLAAVLKNSDLEIMVEGHTDDVPIKTARFQDNWALSVARANAVTRLFVEEGVDPQRVISCGRGEYMPIASNETAEGRQANRRTEIVLAPRLDRLWKLTEQDQLNAQLK
ncbi:OmpA family protein [Luteibaculum oceani]|uniref:OmpA family protein n=1 Tax=Luteibaculum oceani TaxID=1294296 RepID=A0A5C6V4X2_9FLAO|nr:OmpA family protein [Luteibaculum oceani]TXC78605.1 OmpA family protein [Luteibaculum oceani]